MERTLHVYNARVTSLPASLIVLRHLARRLEAALPHDTALDSIVETVGVALDLREATIWLKRLDTGDFEPVARYHSPDDSTGPLQMVSEPRPWPPTATDSQIMRRGFLNLPFEYESEVIGEITIVPSSAQGPVDDAAREILNDIARRIGPVANVVRMTHDLRRSSERLVLAREEERRRLRRDLHDTIGPTLAALNLRAGSIRNLIRNDPSAAEAEMTQLREQLRSVITDIRRVVYNLRPPALDELGMLSAIREHAMQFASQGLRVEFDVPQHLPALPAAVELAAYRIIIEAITNVARHADAENCRVRLSIADNVYIEVMDDGVGLGPDQRAGVGISSMRERAGELGGDVIFESPPGGGTRVLAQLPLGLARDLDSLKTRPSP